MKTLYNEEDPPAAPCVTGETKRSSAVSIAPGMDSSHQA